MVWFHLYELSRVVEFIETEGRKVTVRGGEKAGMGNYCLMGIEYKDSILQDEKCSGHG